MVLPQLQNWLYTIKTFPLLCLLCMWIIFFMKNKWIYVCLMVCINFLPTTFLSASAQEQTENNLKCTQKACSLWSLPVSEPVNITNFFAGPPKPWLPGHRGVDLETFAEQEIFAPKDGVVVFVGYVVDRPVLSIDHANGLRSTFEPIVSKLKTGDLVTAKQLIGVFDQESKNHCLPENCLHWGIRTSKNTYIDPLQLLKNKQHSILLPLN